MSDEHNLHQQAEGEGIAQADRGSTAIVNIVKYEHVPPRAVDSAAVEEATRLLEDLPLDSVPSRPTPPPPGSVGPPMDSNPLFVGREEDLRAIAAEVKSGASMAGPVRTVCVSGIGGVGKTQLAGEFAHRYGRFFGGGVYWLNLSKPDAAAEEIAKCGGAGAMDLRGDFDRLPLKDKVTAVKAAWLNELPRLLVLDNCEDAEALRACRPTTGGCRVLLTSRGAFGDPALAVVAMELQVLDREQSVELLRSRCPGIELEEGDLVAVAEELGDLPLALDLAGRFLYEYRDVVSPSGYVEELRDVEPLNHPSLRRTEGYSPTDHELDVGRTFVVSYQRLDPENATDRLAVRLLARAARFAPGEPIERDLLMATLRDPDGTDESTEVAADAYRQVDALRRLTGLGLVGESEAGLVRMHRLVASFARREVEDGEAQDDVVRAVARETIEAAEANRPSVLTRLLPHLRHVISVLGDRQDETAYMARFALGASFLGLGSYAEAVPLLEGAVGYSTAHSGLTAWVTMRQRSDLGVAMNRAGDPEGALRVYRGVLADQERELGPDHIDVAATLNNTGALLRDWQRFDEVLPLYERALEIRVNELGRQHRYTAESLHNMGALMLDLGRHDEAWPFLRGALEANESAMGPDHLDNVGPLLKTGWLLRRAGNLAEARELYERALKIRESELGPEHDHVGATLHDLGSLLAEQGSPEEARPYLERALQISLDLHGEDHPVTARTLSTLAGVLIQQGDLDTALSLHQRELNIAERIRGEDDPQTAQCLINVATVLALQDRYPEARPFVERAKRILEDTLGEVHPDAASALDNLANLLTAQHHYEEACPLYELALAIRRHALGEEHPETVISMNNLAGLLMHQGSFAEARPYQEQALSIFQGVLGEHPYTAICLNQLADSLRMQGLHSEARPYLNRALVIGEKAFGREHPFAATVREKLRSLDN